MSRTRTASAGSLRVALGPRAQQTSPGLNQRLKQIRLFLCDVDGVLTDGRVFLGQGMEFKAFNIQDGLGMILLKRNGIKVGWISNRPSSVTEQRARELKIDYLHQEDASKVHAAEAILQTSGEKWEQTCFVGDDVVDLGVLRRAGVAVAVANAIDEAKAVAHYVTKAHGGHGAIREIARLILQAQGRWDGLIGDYSR